MTDIPIGEISRSDDPEHHFDVNLPYQRGGVWELKFVVERGNQKTALLPRIHLGVQNRGSTELQIAFGSSAQQLQPGQNATVFSGSVEQLEIGRQIIAAVGEGETKYTLSVLVDGQVPHGIRVRLFAFFRKPSL